MRKFIQTRQDSTLSNHDMAQAVNTLMFTVIFLWFIAHQNLFTPLSVKYGPADVTKATQYQPQSPPPIMDPETIDVDVQEVDANRNVWQYQ